MYHILHRAFCKIGRTVRLLVVQWMQRFHKPVLDAVQEFESLCQEKTNFINPESQRTIIRWWIVTWTMNFRSHDSCARHSSGNQLDSIFLPQTTVSLQLFHRSVNYLWVGTSEKLCTNLCHCCSSYCVWKHLLLQCIMWNFKYLKSRNTFYSTVYFRTESYRIWPMGLRHIKNLPDIRSLPHCYRFLYGDVLDLLYIGWIVQPMGREVVDQVGNLDEKLGNAWLGPLNYYTPTNALLYIILV
jgi:hypothetical protein